MKLFLIILATTIFLVSSKTKEKIMNLKTKTRNDFVEYFSKAIREYNTGDLSIEKDDIKYQTLSEIAKQVATAFGVEYLFPQVIDVNMEKVSKLEISFSIRNSKNKYADKIRAKLVKKKKALVTEIMEYHVIAK